MAEVSKSRPISPHLTIYRFKPTMWMSIVHRITGGALYFGTILMAWWLVATASGEESFNTMNAVYGSIVGQIVLFGYTWALLHHMMGGIRHLVWDTIHAIEKEQSTRLAQATLVASVCLTLLVWIIGYIVR
ncbi:succinate dehydrogenase, cytochrome b556 subunit [Pararhizobium mangrovi]|uniref:Succinate dehydrogenase cytochrome b556 subunit n=1 Tax=Pararhizobium mangrovi TaxID=2590452 RepID=A0A506U242_9HYPH|nr:succinate dehydrogenase, cytochrome b556 subunit [Pararhizobium mangrovi]TPW27045.1 succinate dehydrogenase, cytochrome b556 subunit [Pararhizobium mangrovi]